MKRKVIIGVIVILVAALIGFRIVTSKKKEKTAETNAAKPVLVQKTTKGTIQAIIKVSGNIMASLQAEIFSPVPGKLIRNIVEDGEYVKENQDIALVDRDEIGSSFSPATVKSTISGILLRHYMEPGARVNPMMPVASVGNIERVKAVANLPENDFIKVKPGMTAFVSVDAYPDKKFSGKITRIAPEIDFLSRTGKIEILINNPRHELKAGMFGLVLVLLSTHSDVLVIPRDAIIEDGDNRKVFVAENGKAKEKMLTIGIFDDDAAEVLKGLSEGEELIVEGHRKLNAGDDVRIVEK